MGWGEKAIEIRSVETGHLDGVFMHKRAQRLKFLCERNDKVRGMQTLVEKVRSLIAAEFKDVAHTVVLLWSVLFPRCSLHQCALEVAARCTS